MKILNFNKSLCLVILSGLISTSVYAGGPAGARSVLPALFGRDVDCIGANLGKNLGGIVADDVNLTIVRALEAYHSSIVWKEKPSIRPLTKEEVWPDLPEAKFILSSYLKTLGQEWKPTISSSEYGYFSVAMGVQPSKFIYQRMLAEEALFVPEKNAAVSMYAALYSDINMNPYVISDTIYKKMDNFINNSVVSKDMRGYLTEDLRKQDRQAFLTDLSDYYGVGEKDEATAAFDFFQRHPHGRTLALKRALHSPFSPSQTVESLRALLQSQQLTSVQMKTFKNNLTDLFNAKNMLFNSVANSKPVYLQKEMLTTFNRNLDRFLRNHGFMPRWDSEDPKERELAMEWSQFKKTRRSNDYGIFSAVYKQTDNILQKYGITE